MIQQKFIRLLISYLETIYDEEKAQIIFKKLKDQLQFTKDISEVDIKAYFDASPEDVGQFEISVLLLDVFDITKH